VDNQLGFDYSIFDTNEYDQLPNITDFSNAIEAKTNWPRIRFAYKGVPYDDKVLEVSNIIRDGSLASATATVILSNAAGEFNSAMDTVDNDCKIDLYLLDGGSSEILGLLALFTGEVEHVDYIDATAVFTLRDKIEMMLGKTLGSGQEPVDYYFAPYTPPNLVWDILTWHGELNTAPNNGNPDIDWNSWDSWRDACTANEYTLRARFTGQSIRTALLKIAQLTNSIFWVDAEGRFNFNMLTGPFDSGDNYTRSTCKKIDSEKTKANIITTQVCRYGYSPDDDSWVAAETKTLITSVIKYGIRKRWEEDKMVWHDTSVSAQSYCDNVIDLYSNYETILHSEMMMMAWRHELGEQIFVTDALRGFSDTAFVVEKMLYNVEQGTVVVDGRLIL